jgi:acetoin utilization protein AcuB
MVVRDWMTARVETVRPDDEVTTVREVFRRRRIRQLPVVAADRLIGIVTDRDVRGVDDPHTLVETVMTPTPVTTTPATPVEQAAALLRTRKVGALPVLEGERLVGIVSESDLLAALVELSALLEPTTVLDLECDGDGGTAQRIRRLLEGQGGRVSWMTAIGVHGGRQRITLRVRMPLGHAPEQILEEAGYPVSSCVISSARAVRGGGSCEPAPLTAERAAPRG